MTAKKLFTATSACALAMTTCIAATILAVPVLPGAPGGTGPQDHQGDKGDTGDKGDRGDKGGDTGDKGDHGDSFFTQSGSIDIYNQGRIITQDAFNDTIVGISNSVNAKRDFNNNVNFIII